MKAAFVIAGTHSGVGKTTATLSLLAALHDKAMIDQPFKVGPDYLDPGYHNLFSGGRKSRNLDSFFLSEDYIRKSFSRNVQRADVAIVEGVMGLFDGKSAETEIGSTAHVSKILNLPVILIVDAHSIARSAGAIVLGFKQFDQDVNLKGVIFNRVSGIKHYEYLRGSIPRDWGVEVLGFIARDREIEIPERHLGLTSALEYPLAHSFFDKLKKASESIDTNRLLELTATDENFQMASEFEVPLIQKQKRVRIGVSYDEAFSFYYEDNFDLLQDAGAELIFFSPLYGDVLPENLDALYLGGGFPEMFAPKLSRNLAMIESIQRFATAGHFIYAECGGLIYLAERFRDKDNQVYNLVGIVPGEIEMTDQLQSFGYKEMVTQADTFLFRRGEHLKSHEFHYSKWTATQSNFDRPYQIQERSDGFCSESVLASYQHLHFGSDPSLAIRFVESILEAKVGAKSL